ncbi:MAG: hypothetical protein Q9212_002132 [Teloschistes hypoglaucus]
MQLAPPPDEEIAQLSLCETRKLIAERQRYLESSLMLLEQMKERRIKLLVKLKNEGHGDSEWFGVLQEALEGAEKKVARGATKS